MTSRPNLMVAYLATPGGEDALALGAQLARSFDAELRICLIVPPPTPAEQAAAPGDFQDVLDRQAGEWLSDALASVPDDVVAQGYVAEHENAAEGLEAEAAKAGSSLIVVGGSGGGLLGRHSLGTVVTNLLHVSTTPVVVTPRGMREIAGPVRRITCMIGARPGADALLRAAADAAARAGVPLRLLSLLPLDESGDQKSADVRQAAQSHLDAVVAQAADALPEHQPISTEIASGRTVEEAVSALTWEPGDVVYVGSSRLAQPRHLFLGSTAAKMLRILATPMIVVPRDA